MKNLLIILSILICGCTKNYYIYITPEKIIEYKELNAIPFTLLPINTPTFNPFYEGDLHGYLPYSQRLLMQMDSLIKK